MVRTLGDKGFAINNITFQPNPNKPVLDINGQSITSENASEIKSVIVPVLGFASYNGTTDTGVVMSVDEYKWRKTLGVDERHMIPVVDILEIEFPVVCAVEFREQEFIVKKRRHFFDAVQKRRMKLILNRLRIFVYAHEYQVPYALQGNRLHA